MKRIRNWTFIGPDVSSLSELHAEQKALHFNKVVSSSALDNNSILFPFSFLRNSLSLAKVPAAIPPGRESSHKFELKFNLNLAKASKARSLAQLCTFNL
jgi:hypothetical protein